MTTQVLPYMVGAAAHVRTPEPLVPGQLAIRAATGTQVELNARPNSMSSSGGHSTALLPAKDFQASSFVES